MIPILGWDLAFYLESILPEKFDKFCEHITENLTQWEDYASTNEPQNEPLPEPYNMTLDSFEKLIILKIFRPEKLSFSFTDYVA
jgi:dynein heavy chain, axonemal